MAHEICSHAEREAKAVPLIHAAIGSRVYIGQNLGPAQVDAMSRMFHCFSTSDDLFYHPFCDDFGPVCETPLCLGPDFLFLVSMPTLASPRSSSSRPASLIWLPKEARTTDARWLPSFPLAPAGGAH